MTGIEKWSAIYQSMKENKLEILAVQETHLNDDLIHSINECFRKRITVINSQLQTNPHSSTSIAFVINKALIAMRELEKVELISGRALAIKFKWHKENDITLVNIPEGDMLLGDFNLTEDAIDRAPAHLDNVSAIVALRNLRQCFGVKDLWRHTYPDKRAFTYRATSHSQKIMLRLDRIYVADTTENAISSWKIKQTAVPSDHWLVAVNFAPNQAPYIGKGRWTLQTSELKNEKLTKKIINQRKQLKKDLRAIDMTLTTQDIENLQTLWASFKEDIAKIAKKHCAESEENLQSV
ncbi:hypothetical protein EI94DRAFT_1773126 [Lactarius quietus]|nr:hypothetical protein EI94DRAFT_1773126 [Lactarius quietus]